MLTMKKAADLMLATVRPRLAREVTLYIESLTNAQVAELLSSEYHLIAIALDDGALQPVGRLRGYLADHLAATILERLHLGG